ncbi:MAG TPA: Uma2 family endonuclease, partial [Planctomycetaceae bacterium]|nr:Uma2 family endonuclease [Planctomycetaceae bacterium]
DEEKHLDRADLVVEVVSEGSTNRNRDLIDKRAEYAVAGITEYWIVDPERKNVTVLILQSGEYVESGTFGMNDVVRSTVVFGFEISVAKVFAK